MKSTLSCPYCGNVVKYTLGNFEKVKGSPFRTCMKCGREFVDSTIYEPALYPYSKFIPSKSELFFEKIGNIPFGAFVIVFISIIAALCGEFGWDIPCIVLGGAIVVSIPSAIAGLNNMKKGMADDRFKTTTTEYFASLMRLSDVSYAKKMHDHNFSVPNKFFKESPRTILWDTLNEIWLYDKDKLAWYAEAIKQEIPSLASLIQEFIKEKSEPVERQKRNEVETLRNTAHRTDVFLKSVQEQSASENGPRERTTERLICRKCGKELSQDSEFCNYCGTKIVLIKK